jgi:signal transduction histidine kinase
MDEKIQRLAEFEERIQQYEAFFNLNRLPLWESDKVKLGEFWMTIASELRQGIIGIQGYVALMMRLRPELEDIVLNEDEQNRLTVGYITDFVMHQCRMMEHVINYGAAFYFQKEEDSKLD